MLLTAKLLMLATGAIASSVLHRRRAARAAPAAPACTPLDADSAPAADERGWLRDLPGVSDEATIHQNLTFSGTALTLSAAALVTPIPAALAVPFLGGSCWPVVVNSLGQLRRGERIGVSLIDLFPALIVVSTGHYLAVAVTSSAYHISRKLLVMTEARSRGALIDVFDEDPQFARVIVAGREVERPLGAIEIDDLIAIGAGELVPVDGVVHSGSAWVDQRALTGESQPAELAMGDDVLAATIVVQGRLQVRARRTGDATTAARIGAVLRSTEDFKATVLARGERIIDQGAWPTLGLGALAGVTLGYQSALAMNYAAIGYSARIGVPVSILNYLDQASRAGVLVKDGRSLELLADVDTFIFDKTGTLTDDTPRVIRIRTRPDIDEDGLLAALAGAERRQTHPIARALVAEAERRGLAASPAEVLACRIGYGLEARIEGRTLLIGSARLMKTSGVELTPDWSASALGARAGNTTIYAALDGEVIGAVELAPTLRAGARETMDALRERGIEVYILSGDRVAPTRALADTLGVDGYFAETLPEDKAAVVRDFVERGRRVCFVGDGINDAIALKTAHVSVSMAGASNVAVDTASVVLTDPTLGRLVDLVDLARGMAINLDRGALLAIAPGVACAGAIFLLGVGIPGATLTYNTSLLLCLLNGMAPRWTARRSPAETTPAIGSGVIAEHDRATLSAPSLFMAMPLPESA